MKNILVAVCAVFLTSCAGLMPQPATVYSATYDIQLTKVERPAKASSRYGAQKIDAVADDAKYKFIFEDSLVKVLWIVTARNISFSVTNKTGHSIKIPWDEAAYVDEAGSSHRVMHAGIKYNERTAPMPPTVIVRGGRVEDIVFPTDYVYWKDRTSYSAGQWEEKPLLPAFDYHAPPFLKGSYPTFEAFDAAVKGKIGKTLQVLLPLQIEDVVNDYIFTFTVKNATSKQETK